MLGGSEFRLRRSFACGKTLVRRKSVVGQKSVGLFFHTLLSSFPRGCKTALQPRFYVGRIRCGSQMAGFPMHAYEKGGRGPSHPSATCSIMQFSHRAYAKSFQMIYPAKYAEISSIRFT